MLKFKTGGKSEVTFQLRDGPIAVPGYLAGRLVAGNNQWECSGGIWPLRQSQYEQ